MNISKNLLSLGLIAVISGISTAQTYTATAGTNGITDIQSDYSMSTGDGASVSVDVPLEFELPKKVAIAVYGTNGEFTDNAVFDNSINYPRLLKRSALGTAIEQTPSSFNAGYAKLINGTHSSSLLEINGLIYANTDNVSLGITTSDTLTHEQGVEAGSIETDCWYHLGLSTHYACDTSGYINGGSVTSNIIFNSSEFTSGNNNMSFVTRHGAILSSIDPTDRAGKYLQTVTITVSTL